MAGLEHRLHLGFGLGEIRDPSEKGRYHYAQNVDPRFRSQLILGPELASSAFAANAEAFTPDRYVNTGDFGRIEGDCVYIASRKRDIIRRRGENIAGAELDRVIGAHPAVSGVGVIAVNDEISGEEALAVLPEHFFQDLPRIAFRLPVLDEALVGEEGIIGTEEDSVFQPTRDLVLEVGLVVLRRPAVQLVPDVALVHEHGDHLGLPRPAWTRGNDLELVVFRRDVIEMAGMTPVEDDAIATRLERLDLEDLADRNIDTLSGGERQRLVIARAVAQEAPILLLDEPTSALDIGHQQQALELVDRLRREHGLTVISAMHDLTLAGIYSDRLVLMHEGHRVVHGTAEEVLAPETLAEFYGVSVSVHRDPDGTIVVVPRRGPDLR